MKPDGVSSDLGAVVRLAVRADRRSRVPTDRAYLCPGAGMVTAPQPSDPERSTDREISFLTEEARRALSADRDQGLCFDRFEADITVSGSGLPATPPGEIVLIGTGAVRLTAVRKRCFGECARSDRRS